MKFSIGGSGAELVSRLTVEDKAFKVIQVSIIL